LMDYTFVDVFVKGVTGGPAVSKDLLLSNLYQTEIP